MNTPDGDEPRMRDQEAIADSIENTNIADSEVAMAFNNQRNGPDLQLQLSQLEKEKELYNDWDDLDDYMGRVSPACKEQVYRLYLKGATIKDLSLKFGILA
jgi:hypothetical protein